jgi:hypothetical protein
MSRKFFLHLLINKERERKYLLQLFIPPLEMEDKKVIFEMGDKCFVKNKIKLG